MEIFRLASENEAPRKPNNLLPHSTSFLHFEVMAEVEASEFFEDESVNWRYCKEQAAFSHRHACEFILHCGNDVFTKRTVEDMKAFGCTTNFIDAYIAAAAAGATRVLFYV